MDDDQSPQRPDALRRSAPKPRRTRLHRAEGCRREVLPLLGRLAHDRRMEDEEAPSQPSFRPRPRLN